MPPAFLDPDTAPVQIRNPGGVVVSRVANRVPSNDTAQIVSSVRVVGIVDSVQPANQYNIASFLCEAGQRVSYQVDSAGGLDMNWFQMAYPPLGLFMFAS